MTDQQLLDAVGRNLEWFRNSGVMDPPDGSWGVAERIAVTKDNTAIEKICRAFPAWNEFDGYCVIEPRRPDCNFETALLFLLAGRKFGSEEFTRTGETICMVRMEIDGDACRGRRIEPHPEENERIEVFRVKRSGLAEFVAAQEAEGVGIDTKIYTYLAGMA